MPGNGDLRRARPLEAVTGHGDGSARRRETGLPRLQHQELHGRDICYGLGQRYHRDIVFKRISVPSSCRRKARVTDETGYSNAGTRDGAERYGWGVFAAKQCAAVRMVRESINEPVHTDPDPENRLTTWGN